jgi:hypothetical protein
MAFLFWILFIVSFLLTVSVVIAVLRKKYHGWKSFFTILRNVNILFVCLVIAWIFYISWDSKNRGIHSGGMEILVFPLTLLPLLIIDLILVLSYFFIRHCKSRSIPYTILIPAICLLFILIMIVLRFL